MCLHILLEPRPPRPRPPKRFTVSNKHYGYLHSERHGSILYFSRAKIAPSVFILLRNNAIKDERSGKCWHLKLTPTNQQVFLKSGCYGSRPLRWAIIQNKWLKVKKFRKCLSPWKKSGVPILAGLNRCAAYNQMDIKFLPSKLQKYYLQ